MNDDYKSYDHKSFWLILFFFFRIRLIELVYQACDGLGQNHLNRIFTPTIIRDSRNILLSRAISGLVMARILELSMICRYWLREC